MYFWFAIGVFVGSIVTQVIVRLKSTEGVLRIDHSNPEKDIYRIEFDSIDSLSKVKKVVLKVDNNAVLSQQ